MCAYAIAGGASDDFAKARAGVPYAVTVELPTDKYVGQGLCLEFNFVGYLHRDVGAGWAEWAYAHLLFLLPFYWEKHLPTHYSLLAE